MKIKLQFIGAVLSFLTFACPGMTAHAQEAHEDLGACPGSAPEPGQSAPWSVAFCNRTGHDLVIEFHDNECPAKGWSRRGDVYQRTLRRGESKTLPLCYANEPPGKKPTPGTPTLRIPGGKGVTTTWSVVGECGDRSKPLNLDARTFYDRGEYKTGIILLQYPSGASHCASEAYSAGGASSPASASNSAAGGAAAASIGAVGSSAAVTSSRGAAGSAMPSSASGSPSSAAESQSPTAGTSAPSAGGAVSGGPQPGQPQPPIATHSPIVAPPAVPRTGGSPTLSASVDKSGLVQHIVQVFAKGGAGYKCNFNLLVTFTDGATWNDRAKIDITGNDEQVPITTRKYLKSPSEVKITSNSCVPM